MNDERFELQLRDFLGAEAAETIGAPTANEIAVRITARTRPRFALPQQPALVWVAILTLLLVGLLSAVYVGSQLFRGPELLSTSSDVTELDAGWHQMPLDYTPQSFVISTPPGWLTAEGYVLKGGEGSVTANHVSIATWAELTHVYDDVCLHGLVDAGETAADFMAAIKGQGSRD